jgi:hypothetical protein
MLKVNEETFKRIYLSGTKIVSDYSCRQDTVLIWDDNWWGDSSCEIYIMHPEAYSNYLKFVKKIEEEFPLLAELK